MIDLKDDNEKIMQFIIAGLENFSKEVREPAIMGIYCCPWSGWITLNFNISYSFSEVSYSCPDFEFVEYDFIEFKHWEEEYESLEGLWTDNNLKVYGVNRSEGDEGLNKFFFDYLKDIVVNLNEKSRLPPTLLQFLDSKFCKKII